MRKSWSQLIYTLTCWETGIFVAKHGAALYNVNQIERRKVGSGKTDRTESLSALHPHRSVGMKKKNLQMPKTADGFLEPGALQRQQLLAVIESSGP